MSVSNLGSQKDVFGSHFDIDVHRFHAWDSDFEKKFLAFFAQFHCGLPHYFVFSLKPVFEIATRNSVCAEDLVGSLGNPFL
jgi:hypothetical protein